MRRPWMRPRNSLRGGGYQFAYGPPIVQFLTEAWGCTSTEREGVWRALCASTCPQTVALRQQLLAFHAERQDTHTFLSTVCTPIAFVHCLERMVEEEVISRRLATGIEERLLRHTGADGAWQPQPREHASMPACRVVLVEL
jgi:hypothetical protein